MTLTTGSGPNSVKGGAKALRDELRDLLKARGGKMDFTPYAYNGKGGRMNMVFGIAKFDVEKTWELKHYMFAQIRVPKEYLGKFKGMEEFRVVDGHYRATVNVVDGKLMPHYQTRDCNYFLRADPLDELTVEQVKKWIHFD